MGAGTVVGALTMATLTAFNPHELSERSIRLLSTGREGPLAEILDLVRGNLTGTTRQHAIVSAPRGYGKSFIMRQVQIELEHLARDQGLKLAVALMPEEMPHVKEPETLIRELTRALTGGDGGLAELTWHEDDGAEWDQAVAELTAAIGERVGADGLFVALVENFDLLVRRAFGKDVQASRLRALLSEPGSRLVLVAASASGAFDRDYDQRLFHAFAEIKLEPWTMDECLDFFARQRQERGLPPLSPAALARARAVATFIGGTPRLATLLGDALLDDDVLGAADLLHQLVDELTPYYKDRIEALPGRSQKLLDALLRGGEPATQSDLARRVKARSQAAIAAPFADLVKERVVVGDKAPGSAEKLFRVADRVFAHFYRRRIIAHGRALCPLDALVDLLADFFSDQEKADKAALFARMDRLAEARVMARLLDEADGGKSRAERLDQMRTGGAGVVRGTLAPLASPAVGGILAQVADHMADGDLDGAYGAIGCAQSAATVGCDSMVIWLTRAYLDRTEGIEDGLVALERAAAADDGGIPLLTVMADRLRRVALLDLKRPAAIAATPLPALSVARGAEEMAMVGYVDALLLTARSLLDLGRSAEALDLVHQALDLADGIDKDALRLSALVTKAMILRALGQGEDGLEVAMAALPLAAKLGQTTVEIAMLTRIITILWELSRKDEAVGWGERLVAVVPRIPETTEDQVRAHLTLAITLAGVGRHQDAFVSLGHAAALQAEGGAPLGEWLLKGGGAVGTQLADASVHDQADLVARTLSRLKDNAGQPPLLARFLRGWTGTVLHTVVDPVALTTLAEAIAMQAEDQSADFIVRMLRDVAQYHAGQGDPATLARLPPDMARSLTTTHPYPRD